MIFNIEEQKAYLLDKFVLKRLCDVENREEVIKKFEQATCGSKIEEYLKEKACEDDANLDTKVYFVMDKDTEEIAFYFAINCGIVYSDFDEIKFENEEVAGAFDWCVSALRKTYEAKSNQEKDDANEEYINALNQIHAIVADETQLGLILSMVEEKANKKEEKNELLEGEDENNITKVKETFPAVDLKFLCRNKNFKLDIELDFKLGVYVFWEMIVPKILEISENVGCKYVYLFAADNSETMASPELHPWDDDYFEDDGNTNEKNVVRKLVEYYMNELKFANVTQYKILKPHYERYCYTLVQEVSQLQKNRDMVWESHKTE